jgi:hypothetical protein
VIVENYTIDLMGRANLYGRLPLKQVDGSISRRAHERIIREAKRDYLDGYDIDWSRYEEPTVVFHDMMTCQIEWKHKVSGREIHLSNICFDKRTGAIDQAGTNYGSLTL